MLGIELDKFVSDNAGPCMQCRKLNVEIGRAWHDVHQAFSLVKRWPNSEKCKTAVKARKKELENTRVLIVDHMKEH